MEKEKTPYQEKENQLWEKAYQLQNKIWEVNKSFALRFVNEKVYEADEDSRYAHFESDEVYYEFQDVKNSIWEEVEKLSEELFQLASEASDEDKNFVQDTREELIYVARKMDKASDAMRTLQRCWYCW